MTFVSTNFGGDRILRAGLQTLMILLGVAALGVGIYRLRSDLTVSEGEPRAAAPAPAAEPGFVPVLDPAASPGVTGSSSRSASPLQMQWKFEQVLGAEAGGQPAEAVVTLARNRPVRLVIPRISLEAPVVSAALMSGEIDGQRVYQWTAPDFYAAGWHHESAELGEQGNVVINGHHNVYGEVFRNLNQLEQGDRILVYANEEAGAFRYEVTRVMTLNERDQPLEVRAENARWIQSTDDERLTLITCWPYESNSHRLIVVAKPIDAAQDLGKLEDVGNLELE